MIQVTKRATGIVLISVIVFAIFAAHNTSSAAIEYLQRAFLDSLHAPGFAVATFVALLIVVPKSKPLTAIITVAAASTIVAFLAEGSQMFGPRDADSKDLAMDLIGIACAVSIAVLLTRGARQSVRKSLLPIISAVAVLLTAATFGQSIYYAHAIVRQQSLLPTLVNFESDWQMALFTKPERSRVSFVQPPANWAATGHSVAKFDLGVRQRPGVELKPHSDWRECAALRFVAASAAADPYTVSLRIHDIYHDYRYDDRYNVQFRVTQTPTLYEFSIQEISNAPAGRAMDIARIESIIWFVVSPNGDERLLIDDIQLTSAALHNGNDLCGL